MKRNKKKRKGYLQSISLTEERSSAQLLILVILCIALCILYSWRTVVRLYDGLCERALRHTTQLQWAIFRNELHRQISAAASRCLTLPPYERAVPSTICLLPALASFPCSKRCSAYYSRFPTCNARHPLFKSSCFSVFAIIAIIARPSLLRSSLGIVYVWPRDGSVCELERRRRVPYYIDL